MYPLGDLPQKNLGGEIFSNPLGSGAWSKIFLAIVPEKMYPKLVSKFLGLPPKKYVGGGSNLAHISQFSDFFAHFSKTVPDITNLKTDF